MMIDRIEVENVLKEVIELGLSLEEARKRATLHGFAIGEPMYDPKTFKIYRPVYFMNESGKTETVTLDVEEITDWQAMNGTKGTE